MIEYPAMVYRNKRNNVYVANCIIKNIVGFGKTQQDALNNLKESLQSNDEKNEIVIKPFYGSLMAQNG